MRALAAKLREAALAAANESSRHPNSYEGVRLLRLAGILSAEAHAVESIAEAT